MPMICYKGKSKVYLCQQHSGYFSFVTQKNDVRKTDLHFGFGYSYFEFYMRFCIITCEKQQTDFIYRRVHLLRFYSAGSW